MNASRDHTIVVVHGLWTPVLLMRWLGRRLRGHGYRVRYFGYPTVHGSVADAADRLADFIGHGGDGRCHVVAHSLGGLVTLSLIHRHPDVRVGRIVALGTPFKGAYMARVVAGLPFGRTLLGRSLDKALDGRAPAEIPAGYEVGVIAGTNPVGPGLPFSRLERPHDGVVSVNETVIAGTRAHHSIPVTHLGLIFSNQAVTLTTRFLETSWFDA